MRFDGSPESRGRTGTVLIGALLLGCGSDSNTGVPARAGTEILSVETATSSDLCRLQGGAASRPGVYGTDLGFSFVVPGSDRMVLLFGDTWKSSTSVCDYPPRKSDDLQATLPAALPAVLGTGTPAGGNVDAICSLMDPPPDASDPATPRPIRLFPNAGDNSDSAALYTDFGRTPVAGFSDGVHAVALFVRNEPQACDVDADCSGSLICTKDPAYSGKPLGECSPSFNLSAEPAPSICRLDVGGNGDCGSRRACVVPSRGVCRSDKPFVIDSANGPVSPPWYDEDARRAMAQTLYIASSAWPDRPEDYATGARFVTSKFVNPVVRTVKRFDARDPTKNDYSPGSDALLMWGRPAFWGRRGFQPLLFFLHQSLDGFMDADGTIHWSPNYFAGYGTDGRPKWSQDEAEAVPVYGGEAAVGETGGAGSVSEFDLVSQLTMSYVEPLKRWVMLYGGDLPTWIFYDPATDTEIAPLRKQPVPGAIHLRYASHPWGRGTRDAAVAEAWSEAIPVLTRENAAPYLGCEDQPPMLDGCTAEHDPHRPLQLILAVDTFTAITPVDYPAITKSCIDGDAVRNASYQLSGDGTGHLYAPNILESWTQDVTASVEGIAPSGKAVDLYFNVSTWNPYGVVLMKTQLIAEPAR